MSFPGDEEPPEKPREKEDGTDETRQQATAEESAGNVTTETSDRNVAVEAGDRDPVTDEPNRESETGQFEERKTGPNTHYENKSDNDPDEWVLFARDILTSILAVALLGGYIFMISGVWPPMVAVESGSMEPNLEINDLVFVMDNDRFHPSEAHEDTGIVTAEAGSETGYTNHGDYGDVIVFAPQGNENATPVIHRVMFWVEEDENWYDRADEAYIGNVDSCDEMTNCPAPNDGFVTKGDNNPTYDQTGNGEFDPVETEWVVGTAEYRVPGLGWLRLQFE